jgi:hypothetical protein
MPLPGMGMAVPLLYGSGLQHPMANMMPHEAANALSFIDGQFCYVNDFVDYLGPAGAGTQAGWVQTLVGTGTAALIAAVNNGGVLSLTSGATSGDLNNLQRIVEDYRFVLGKQSGFMCSLGPGAAITTVDFLFGLAILDTSLIVSAPSDGLFFTKLAASNVFNFQARKGGTSTTVTPVDQQIIAANVGALYGFTVNVDGSIDVWWGTAWSNLRRVGRVAAGDANIPNTQTLTLSFSLRATASAARSLLIDGVSYWREI